MNSAEKKEGDISKDKVRIVRTNYRVYMARHWIEIEESADMPGIKLRQLWEERDQLDTELKDAKNRLRIAKFKKQDTSKIEEEIDTINGALDEVNKVYEDRENDAKRLAKQEEEREREAKEGAGAGAPQKKKGIFGGIFNAVGKAKGAAEEVEGAAKGAVGEVAGVVEGAGEGAAPPEGAPPGGGEGAGGAAVAEALTAEAKEQRKLAEKQAAQSKILIKETEDKLKELKSKFPSKSKIMLAFIIAVIYDFTDFVVAVATSFRSERFEWAADIPMRFLFGYLLGPYYTQARFNVWPLKKIPAPWLEFIPFLDLLPFYTHFVNQARKKLKDSHNEMDRLEEELRKLKGEGEKKEKGFLDISPRGWAIRGAISLPIAAILFLLLKQASLIPIAGGFAVYFFILLLRCPETKGYAKIILIVLGICAFIGGVFIFFIAPMLADYGGPLGESASAAAGAPTRVKAWLKDHNPITAIRNYYKKQLLIATGDYYTGKVDENAEAKLGVYLEDLKQADPVFYTDRQLIMFATLKVQTLDEPVNVKMYCKTEGLEGNPPALFPKSEFLVDTYEEQDIDCMFEANSVRKGTWSFELGADFNFKTMSYVKSYFMDAERLRSMRREEIDPLEQYGIKDKSPTAIYTVGPVGIGMGVGKPPVGIDSEQPQTTVTLGITIENLWEGDIIKLNRFIVIVPKGFTLEEIGAQKVKVECSSLPGEEQALCDDELNNVYLVSDPTFVEVGKGNFKSYRGYLRLNRADYEKVLGMTPISTKYFKTTVGYTYRLKKTKIVEVKSREVAGIPGLVAGAGADVVAPKIEKVEVDVLDTNSIKISWKTNEETNDNLVWWDVIIPHKAKEAPGEAGFTKEHSRTLTEISSSKTYGYKITSTDKNGNMAEVTKTYPPS